MRTVSVPNEYLLTEVSSLLSDGNIVTLKAKGHSMLPFIVGDRDNVVLQKKEIYAVRDIVLAEVDSKHFVLHRIINIEKNKITLMGDGNIAGTERCNINDIRGYAVSIVRKGKTINCNSKSESYKAYLWQKLLPFRRYLLAIYKRIII